MAVFRLLAPVRAGNGLLALRYIADPIRLQSFFDHIQKKVLPVQELFLSARADF